MASPHSIGAGAGASPGALAATLALGLAQHQAGRLDAAAACYRTVLAGEPDNAEALHRLGLVAYQQGRPTEAASLIGAALARAPGDAGAHNNLALVLMALGRHAEAIAACNRAVALRPDNPGALSNRGIALRALGRAAEAVASLQRALALRPAFAEAHMNLGLALADLGQPAAALASHDRALAVRPDYAEALSNRGTLLLALGRADAALASLDRAAALQPDQPDIARNRGNALRLLERYDAALASYDRALALRADDAETLANRALALAEADQPEAALASADRALALAPGLAEAHATRGAALRDLGRAADATAAYASALALAPGHERYTLHLALCCLRSGQLPAGWRHFECRWRTGPDGETLRGTSTLSGVMQDWERRFAQPRWRGEPLGGRSLLVHADQGFGDAIMLSRYVPLLAALPPAAGAGVWFQVQPELVALFAGMPRVAGVLPLGAELPAFERQCALADLPGIFATDLRSIPPPPAWLRPAPDRAAAWAARLPRDGRLRVGLAWSGSRGRREDRARSLALAQLQPLVGRGARCFAVHKDVRESDFAAFPGLEPLSAGFADFADTAAAMLALDLVITVDTSVAHLAATLGVPTWVLLPFVADWRWQTDRDDSPWYPAARLFRQRRRGDWAEVIGRVGTALDQRIVQGAGAP